MKDAGVKERDIFTCITKAFEFLSDPVKRKSYDSVDPTFDETVPSVSESNKKNFYKVNVHDSNAHSLTVIYAH